MSDVIDQAVKQLNAKIGTGYDGTAKFRIEGEGTIVLDRSGAREADEADEATDVTMTADPDTFRQVLDGDLDPTAAFMSGRLKVDGDMGEAMKLAQVL